MATVYRAYDRRLDVFRAVKMLLPEYAQNVAIRRRFEMEARTTAKLHHGNIVTVHDVSVDGDKLFIVMELITGGCLMDRVREKGPLPPRLAVKTMVEVLKGLHYAHENGVIHRDIKPHNVMVTKDGKAKLADFGIAHVSDTQSDSTRTGTVMGTWAYMAPEQRASARQVDARSDVYAATATLFALVTGQEPFDLFAPDAHTKQFADMPAALEAIIRRGSSYLQEGRYDNALEFKMALEEIMAELPGDPPGLPPLASLELVARFERGSLSGIESQPLALSDSIGKSVPTFVAEAQPVDYATASGRFQDLDDSFLREEEAFREVTDKALTDEKRRRSWITKAAVVLAALLGLSAVSLVALIVLSVQLWTGQPVADIAQTPASAVEMQGSVQQHITAQNTRELEDSDTLAPPDPAGSTADPAKAAGEEEAIVKAPTPSPAGPTPSPAVPQPNAEPSPAPSENAVEQGGSAAGSGPPTGRLRLRCQPSCEISIRSTLVKNAQTITEQNTFDGRVPLGENLVRMTAADGTVKRRKVQVFKQGIKSICWDFSLNKECKREAAD